MKQFNFKAAFLRLAVLGLGASLAFGASKEPKVSLLDTGSFFFASNPSQKCIGETLKELINKAKNSLDIQIYSLADQGVINTLNKAAAQKKITIYYDKTASRDLEQKLSPEIALTAYTKKGLMHRKIMCIDDEFTFFGSANFTSSSLFWHSNGACLVKSRSLNTFLKAKTRGSCSFEYGRAFLLPDKQNEALKSVQACLKSARKSIHLMMFSFTHPVLIDEVMEAQKRGVKTFLYLDKLNFQNPESPLCSLMKKCDKVFKEHRPVLMHHKLCFIDDHVLITGSANWTRSGFKKNEEVLVIFDKLETSWLEPLRDQIKVMQEELAPFLISNDETDNG